MGYVYAQEGGEYGDNVHFNHCTFLNVMMFTLELGQWWKMSVTNSIFVNTFMLGDIPAQRAENSDPNGGTVRIDSVANFGYAVPFTEQDRRILFAYNSYYTEDWLKDWMANSPYSISVTNPSEIPRPQPMLSPATRVFFDSTANGQKLFPYMNRGFLYDNANPNFLIAPTNVTDLKTFINYKWTTNADINWAFNPQAGTNQIWPINENLSYNNSTLRTAGMGGFPLGDLYRWWPLRYTQWKAQADTENTRINTWLNSGKDPVTSVTPVSIALARAIPDFTADVTIEGVITTVDFQLSSANNGEFYLQDATGGIRLFNSGGKIAVSPGTLVRVKNGVIGTDPNGRKNIETVRDSVVVLGAPGLPAPKITTVDSYQKNRIGFEGQYISIRRASISSGTWPAANAIQL